MSSPPKVDGDAPAVRGSPERSRGLQRLKTEVCPVVMGLPRTFRPETASARKRPLAGQGGQRFPRQRTALVGQRATVPDDGPRGAENGPVAQVETSGTVQPEGNSKTPFYGDVRPVRRGLEDRRVTVALPLLPRSVARW